MNQKFLGVLMIALGLLCLHMFPEDGTAGVMCIMLGIAPILPEKKKRRKHR